MHPIRFSSVDDMTGATSFVAQNNTIHTSYNRGIALSGTTNALVQNNVLFDIRGHSIFNEYANERNNTIANNLVVSTRKAFNLLESDLQPASFWITNPANSLVDNVASGSDAHGFFYNLPDQSLGPLGNTDFCPNQEQVVKFEGNKAHQSKLNGLTVYPELNSRYYPCYQVLTFD